MSDPYNPMDRRTFLKALGAAGASAAVLSQPPLAKWASPQSWVGETVPLASSGSGENPRRNLERKASAPIQLAAVDAVDITILVDNFVDILLPSTLVAQRAPGGADLMERDPLVAEHGYAALLTVRQGDRTRCLLYDTGMGRESLVHNVSVLRMSLDDVKLIVLSHGHMDHHGGMLTLLQRLRDPKVQIVLHPDALLDRRLAPLTGDPTHLPPPRRQDLVSAGASIVERKEASLWLDGTVLVTGQVERTTDFEKGSPAQQALVGEQWQPDPMTWDDQAVVCNLKGKGLVVLSGCSHAGAINVLRYAQQLTGIQTLHAFVGGMHLTGGQFDAIIPRTVDELAAFAPQVIVPCHCTGWKATHEIARRLPQAFVQTSVGSRLHLA
jgi:7,8-dihydropterin-6-yl-methyl-4-(beta-D-ribofuranosyl)aminobenzene 5'-phosphate synthase